MFFKILHYCLTYILYAYGYQPLRDGQYDNYVYEEVRWVTVNSYIKMNTHPVLPLPCKLVVTNNWAGETHEDITGQDNETHKNVESLFPRYYIKKRLATNPGGSMWPRVQYVALLYPDVAERPGNTRDLFPNQLMAIFCQNGIIEEIYRFFSLPSGSNCDIEEKLVALCLLDLNVGSLTETNQMFDYFPHAQVDPITTEETRILVNGCVRFAAQKLPTHVNARSIPHYHIKDYLKGARRAGFNRVIVHGYGVDDQCQADRISWSYYEVDWMLQNELVTSNLFSETFDNRSNQWLRGKVWYFCLYV